MTAFLFIYLIVGFVLMLLFYDPACEVDIDSGFNIPEKVALLILAWPPIYSAVIRRIFQTNAHKEDTE
jgi:hypothetical protein